MPTPSSPAETARAALAAFDAVVQSQGGFRHRPGQRSMAEKVAQTFADASLGKASEDGEDEPVRAIAVVQAGTGVGKSLAYCAPAIAVALARGTRVLISTATVALQEQLVTKDLPALAAAMPEPFRFALAKGRGRYVCKLKLGQLAGTDEPDGDDDLFADDPDWSARPRAVAEARVQIYAAMGRDLASGAWDGDRDSLPVPPEADAWVPVAAEGSSCTGKHCPVFGSCSYYEKRKELVGAQVIVANHDLLLSSLGSRLLPELDNCLLVLDEGHHLPAVALDQFACSTDLSRTGWIDTLARRVARIGGLVAVSEAADVPRLAHQLRQTLSDIGRLVMDLHGPALQAQLGTPAMAFGPARVRLVRGELPPALDEPLRLASVTAELFLAAVQTVAKALRADMRERPEEARRLSTLYAQIGMLAPRLEAVHDTAQLLLAEQTAGAAPAAKWITLQDTAALDGTGYPPGAESAGGAGGAGGAAGSVGVGGAVFGGGEPRLRLHASPILPGQSLRYHLWSKVRGAVVTSATLTSCGQFDFFLRESGLHGDAAASTLDVPSPFDYAAQGAFVVVETRADPKQAAAFTAEMVQALARDVAGVQHGALALFTSRDQMRQAVEAVERLASGVRESVLVQGEQPRTALLRRHRERVEQGLASTIFGMQSFGEGLDLPGRLCETVFIAKLPFAPPDDPVGEARAEWLRSVGRDPFSELVVPATAVRLAQWAGRAIRTETDRSLVYCYDRRLTSTGYGQRLMQGLPPFARRRRAPSGDEVAMAAA